MHQVTALQEVEVADLPAFASQFGGVDVEHEEPITGKFLRASDYLGWVMLVDPVTSEEWAVEAENFALFTGPGERGAC
jgi:hypothetical protein